MRFASGTTIELSNSYYSACPVLVDLLGYLTAN